MSFANRYTVHSEINSLVFTTTDRLTRSPRAKVLRIYFRILHQREPELSDVLQRIALYYGQNGTVARRGYRCVSGGSETR